MTPNDSGAEGDRRDAETNRIAAETNRMVAEDARVTTDTARSTADTDRSTRRRRINYAQILAYVLIAAVAAFGFYSVEKTQDDLCTVATENRDAIRHMAHAIDMLGRDLVLDGTPPPDASPEQRRKLERLADFAKAQTEVLNRKPACHTD